MFLESVRFQFYLLYVRVDIFLANQPISQSANQPISQSANQPISQSANQPISQSAHEATS
ncbi:hypothetical protein [Shewanella sp. WPAGA9]|uniref:hypothetical protein n=1 Tax=Shewanella sp. ENK2 TaxID=2775245 RepID=UPI0017867A71|nr:hypothetical protein [Shewanella sp. WPAGA9]